MNAPGRWKIVFALIAIFVAGAMTGGLTAIRLARLPKYETPRQVTRENDFRHWFTPVMDRWRENLRLKPEQEEKARPILQQAADDLSNLRSLDLRETDGILSRAQDRLKPILESDQHERFQQLREEYKRQQGELSKVSEQHNSIEP
jgi:hypothetical protein